MTAWHRGALVAYDCETTGVDIDSARIVTATIVEINPGQQPVIHEWLLNPGVDIPAGAAAIHGITTQRAREDGQDPAPAVFEIAGRLALALRNGFPVIAYNAAFDLSILDREARRHGIDPLCVRLDAVAPVVDPFVLDKQLDRYRKGKRTLDVTCAHHGIHLTGAHDASADALATARLAYRLAEKYPDQVQVPLEQLHEQQIGWRAEQCASLQAYFRRTRPDAVVAGEWPVQPLPQGWDPVLHPVDDDVEAGAA